MSKIIELQMSLFGNYPNFQTNSKFVIEILNKFQDLNFIPTSIDLGSIDILTGRIGINSRLALKSQDKEWTIGFLDNRIDINYNKNNNPVKIDFYDNLVDKAIDLLKRIFSIVKENHGYRLALNSKIVLDEITETKIQKFHNKFIIPLKSCIDCNFSDWGVRFNTQKEINIGENKKEICNRILEISKNTFKIPNKINEFHQAVLISVDVNTLPENCEMRFKPENLIIFSSNAKEFIKSSVNEIEVKYNE